MNRSSLGCLLFLFASLCALPAFSQRAVPATTGEQVSVQAPQPSALTPSPDATVEELERRGDQLRSSKDFFDALDFFEAALKKDPRNARLFNKAGITELMLQHYKKGEKDFRHAIKFDKTLADAYNNLGVIRYEEKKYDSAITQYNNAIRLNDGMASFYGNMGAAY